MESQYSDEPALGTKYNKTSVADLATLLEMIEAGGFTVNDVLAFTVAVKARNISEESGGDFTPKQVLARGTGITDLAETLQEEAGQWIEVMEGDENEDK